MNNLNLNKLVLNDKVGIVPSYARDWSNWDIATVFKITKTQITIEYDNKSTKRFTKRFGTEIGNIDNTYSKAYLTTTEFVKKHNNDVLEKTKYNKLLSKYKNLYHSKIKHIDTKTLQNLIDVLS